jgi:hypothetical protein
MPMPRRESPFFEYAANYSCPSSSRDTALLISGILDRATARCYSRQPPRRQKSVGHGHLRRLFTFTAASLTAASAAKQRVLKQTASTDEPHGPDVDFWRR